jgi:hypothetical protein
MAGVMLKVTMSAAWRNLASMKARLLKVIEMAKAEEGEMKTGSSV